MLSFISTVVNYEYAFYWSFYQVRAWWQCSSARCRQPACSSLHCRRTNDDQPPCACVYPAKTPATMLKSMAFELPLSIHQSQQDGSIGYEIKLTGELSTNNLSPGEGPTPGHGTLVAPGVNAQHHQHM